MHLWQAVVLGAVEGLTEFLPVSSTAHLTITEKALGFRVDDTGITAFTAIVQAGAILAAALFLRRDLLRLLRALVGGLRSPTARRTPDFRPAILLAAGSVPIGLVGVAFKDQIETTLRSLWVVGVALVAFSAVLWWADRHATQDRGEDRLTLRDTLAIGLAQCVALVPGVSRSGATMSAGLVRGLDRVTATRVAFFLAIPALTGATLLEVVSRASDVSRSVGWGPTVVATAASFVVGYAAVAWLLRWVARHDLGVFVGYRVAVGGVLLALLATGVVAPT